jgi:hydrogenase maturation protein HypF
MIRVAVHVRGVVQGVGFRPFVHGAATARGLGGWVCNRGDGLGLELEGPAAAVHDFLETLRREPPPAARVDDVRVSRIATRGEARFSILTSAPSAVRPVLPADLALCVACATELESPADRRYRYPFTNCARCGPRYTIIEALPYDRVRTTMRAFRPCPACAAEYAAPRDRRFHAEPIACPACGPVVRAVSCAGAEEAGGRHALAHAVRALDQGRVVAVKGLGGFQLLVDAGNDEAVARLRRRKRREEKPFAVMCPSLAAVRSLCEVSPEEERVLQGPEAPIVLLERRPAGRTPCRVADGVAPGNPRLGVMLPYTPLHRLLLTAAARPLVCTSGNLSEEPICIDDAEAFARLGGVADLFVVHDRAIVRPVDDSVVRVGPAGPEVLRRARGFAPLGLRLGEAGPCVLALGGHLKSTVTLTLGDEAVVSQHLGDLGSPQATRLLERTVDDLVRFFDAAPAVIACDLHPDYVSTRLAERLALERRVPLVRVQHHHAHVAAAMAEHGLSGPVLGLAWDGAGLGPDGVVWGGEALVVDRTSVRRVAHLRPFRLPGGERAMREPRRAALGLAYELFGHDAAAVLPAAALGPGETHVLLAMLARGVHAPWTTSMGRLFDAVAALARIRQVAGFEGQAAMDVEFAAGGIEAEPYPLPLGDGDPAIADWAPLVHGLLADRAHGAPPARLAARFHAALPALALAIAERTGLPHVVLSGGCFQNRRLACTVRERLERRGFAVFVPQRYPPNDGGLSLGQARVALWQSAVDAARFDRKEDGHVPRHSG